MNVQNLLVIHRIAKIGIAVVFLISYLAIQPMAGHAADSSLGASLCAVLKKLLPEVKTYKPEGAQSQLVMAVAEKFDYDAAKLSKVKKDIDTDTTASCPKDRQAMLGILKMKSLAEAVR